MKGRGIPYPDSLLPESLELDGMDTALLEKVGLEKVGFSVEEWAEFLSHRGMPHLIDPSQALVFCGISGGARENGGEMNT